MTVKRSIATEAALEVSRLKQMAQEQLRDILRPTFMVEKRPKTAMERFYEKAVEEARNAL